MAATKTNKTATKKAAATEEVIVELSDRETKERPKAREVDLNDTVVVRNGFQGKLVYTSPRTGEVFQWDSFGDEQEMELRELKNAKASAKKFFQNNWFMFDEDWIIDWLGMKQFYAKAVPIDKFDDTFKLPAEQMKTVLSGLSDGQKRSMAYRAKQLIAEGEIDSIKSIRLMEEMLGIDLVEK